MTCLGHLGQTTRLPLLQVLLLVYGEVLVMFLNPTIHCPIFLKYLFGFKMHASQVAQWFIPKIQ